MNMEMRDLPNLPNEIWAKIFSHLPLADRKSVRLCCRRFYDVCNCDRMLEGERIVFQGNFNFGPAIASLSSSHRRIWHIGLRRVPLDDTDCDSCLLFFRHQGAKVRSLIFDKCFRRDRADLVARLVTSCPYLREIHFVFDTLSVSPCFCRHFVDALKVLTDSKVIRDTVESFTLQMPKFSSWTNDFSLTNGDFLRIFHVFPNIKNLHLTIRVHPNFDRPELADADLDSYLTFSCIHDQLVEMRHQLVRLQLHFMSETCNLRLSAGSWLRISEIEAPHLKELALNWNYVWDSRVMPLSPSKHLTHFDCALPWDVRFYSYFVLRLLRAATELRTLTLRTPHNFSMSAECFRAVVASRLTTLSFYLQRECAPTVQPLAVVCCALADTSADRSMAPNRTLRRLQMDERSSRAWYLFGSYFKSLENFICADFQPQTWLRLFQRLPNLSDLVLVDYSRCELLEYSDPLSYSQLENVRRLMVNERTSAISEFMLCKWTFPKLKVLEIRRVGSYEEFDSDALLLAIGKLSELELLDIRCTVESPFQGWLDLVNALPKLRTIILLGTKELGDEQYRHLFRIRPSLRLICVIVSDDDLVYYLKDIITDSVEKRCRWQCTFSALIGLSGLEIS